MPKSQDNNGKILIANNLSGDYVLSNSVVHAVEDCSLELKEGDIVGIVGESGCGKSTLGKLLLGYDKPPLRLVSGKVIVDGIDVYGMPLKKRRRNIWGLKISRIPQYSMNSLNPVAKIEKIVRDYYKSKFPRMPEEKAIALTRERFKEVGLDEEILDRYPFELSGGMKQRVVIIISTLLNPKCVLADEPTTALDVSTQRRLIEFMYSLVKKKIISSMIFFSHDIATLNQICNKFYVMYAGEIVEFGKREEILNKPFHPYTKLLISAIPDIDPKIKKIMLKDIPGFPPDLRNPPSTCRFYERCLYAEDACKEHPPLKVLEEGRAVRCHLFSK